MKPTTILSICILIMMAFFMCSSKHGKPVFHVNPKDPLPQEHIYSNIHDALEASRNFKGKERLIVLTEGKYYLDSSLFLGKEDSLLTISGKEGQKPIIYGGYLIQDWKKEGKFFVATVNKKFPENYNFKVLEVNGRVAMRSRLPEKGYFKHNTKFTNNWASTTAGGWVNEVTYNELTTMDVNPEDLSLWKDELASAEITVMHEWDETLMDIKEVDEKNNRVVFKQPLAYVPGAFKSENYSVWNTKKGLKKEGTWYFNKTEKKIYYLPLEGEAVENMHVVCPLVENVIKIANSGAITIRNLSIRASTSPLIVGGFGAKWFDGAISLSNTNNCSIEDIEFYCLSANAVKGVNNDYSVIANCYFHNIGGAAIRNIGSHCKIDQNLVHDVGLIYPSTIAIYCNVTDPNAIEEWKVGKDESNVKITHNTVHDVPYSGIVCGGNNSVISSNKVHKAMKVLHDGSGIYITFCNNLQLNNNMVFDIEGRATSAFYLDEGTNNSIVSNNLSFGVSRPIQIHMSVKNKCVNNILIIEKGDAAINLQRSDSISFIKNIIVSSNKIFFQNIDALTFSENNIAYAKSAGGQDTSVYLVPGVTTNQVKDIEGFIEDDPGIEKYKTGKVMNNEG